MGNYRAEPGSQVLGHSILITLEALGIYKETGLEILSQVGLKEVKADGWYDMQLYCDFLGILREKIGPSTLFVAGRNIGLNADLPPIFDTPAKVLSSFDQVFKMGHKGISANQGWTHIQTGEKSAIMISSTPYPDDLQRGVCDGFIRRFKPGAIVVRIDETKPRVDSGGKSVTFIATWS